MKKAATILPVILPTGANNKGFSLLELLVVIFIIGLMSGVAVLTLPSQDNQVLLAKQRLNLMASLRSAKAEAVFSGRSYGLLWSGREGRYYRLTEGGWVAVDEGILAKRLESDPAVLSELRLSGQAVSNNRSKAKVPQILFLGDGQISPFEWTLRAESADSLLFDQRLSIEQ